MLFGLVPAQAAPAVDRLQKLLGDLAATDPSVWAARQARLEAQAAAREQEAKELRDKAAALQAQAAAKDAAVARLRGEIELSRQLQALLAKLAKAAPDAGTAPAPMLAKSAAASGTSSTKSEDVVSWRSHVEALLGERCAGCHDQDSKKGGLDVTSFAAIRQGGSSGRTLLPGQPDQSRLYRLVARLEQPFMPKDEDQLPAAAIATLRRWIEQGACEDDEAARAFLAEKARAAASQPAPAAPKQEDGDGPMPVDLPPVSMLREGRPGAVKSLARSPRAPLLSMPGHGQVLLLDTGLQLLAVLPSALGHVETVGFAADGRTLFAAGGEPGKHGCVELFDVRTGARLATVGDERDPPLAAAVAAGGDPVALGGSGKHTRVFRRDGTLAFAGRHDDFVLALAFAPGGALLAAADRAGVVRVYQTGNGRLEQTLSGHSGAVHAVVFCGDDRVATAGADGTVRLWDVGGGRELWRQNAHTGEALGLASSPGDRLASCGSDGRVRVFSRDGQPIAQSPPAGEWLYAVAFGAGEGVVYAGDWQGRVHSFDVAAKKLTHVVPLGPAQ